MNTVNNEDVRLFCLDLEYIISYLILIGVLHSMKPLYIIIYIYMISDQR